METTVNLGIITQPKCDNCYERFDEVYECSACQECKCSACGGDYSYELDDDNNQIGYFCDQCDDNNE